MQGISRNSNRPRSGSRRGFSLIEVMVVLIILGVLLAMAAPNFRRSIEQSRADIAAANMRAIWAAERLYWIENGTYTTDLNALEALGLVDSEIVSGTPRYDYAVPSADATTFSATATRVGSSVWSGSLTIDETAAQGGVISASGEPDIVPGFN